MEISLKDTLVFFLFTLPVSLSVSTWVVAKFIWEPYVKKSTAEMEDWLDEQEPAKYGYPIDRAKDTPAEGRKGMPLLNCLLAVVLLLAKSNLFLVLSFNQTSVISAKSHKFLDID